MFLKPNDASNLVDQLEGFDNVNFSDKYELDEPLYSSITPYKIKKKILSDKKSTTHETQKHTKFALSTLTTTNNSNNNNNNNDLSDNCKRISFNIEKKDFADNPHDYYSIFADSFQHGENKLNINGKSFSLSDLDKIRIRKTKHPTSYKNKFFSLNHKLRTKLIKKLNDFNNRQPILERLIRKNGDVNINRVHIARRHRKYISDLFNTVIGMRILCLQMKNIIIRYKL